MVWLSAARSTVAKRISWPCIMHSLVEVETYRRMQQYIPVESRVAGIVVVLLGSEIGVHLVDVPAIESLIPVMVRVSVSP